ncbi:MAG: F0F1 ATP synthase subunit epsilon [Muribaculaceae bacterium]|nr:F0F1 ATP synthase subunit epsilon [Muribaculaceae bacterium]MDE5969032.1 F0F1 ATP synthase subunit epsilon [Muribaculaceae bacterium]MDE7392875.1 F0F1 ATP synthase subunit epsilon [Muribaculaceae bacterium]
MTLKIISATEILFQGEVASVTLPGQKGRFTVLNNHASLISTLVAGDIVYDFEGNKESRHIDGGIVDVDKNIISVCVS